MTRVAGRTHLNAYLADKQHLLPGSQVSDVVQVTRDLVALHATSATTPYLSLQARVTGFRRQMLDIALYKERTLVKTLSMRVTLHAVPSDDLPLFFQAFAPAFHERRTPPEFRVEVLLVRAGLCREEEAQALRDDLQHRVLAFVAGKGSATVRQIGREVPEIRSKIRHSEGKRYEGEFSIGSRLIPRMCAQGLLVRARPRGTWRSSLYEYAVLADWLPDVDLKSVTPAEAQAWLVHRYLATFGPATADDARWWTGLTRSEVRQALDSLGTEVSELAIEGIGDGYLALAGDVERLHGFRPPSTPGVFLLPALDPYIMAYSDRSRFLAPEHRARVFDRAGNAAPTIWIGGCVAGVWGQREDARVFCKLFVPVGEAEQAMLATGIERLEEFLDGETLPPGIRTPFARDPG